MVGGIASALSNYIKFVQNGLFSVKNVIGSVLNDNNIRH